MNADDIIKRAEASANLCELQGFVATASALRAVARELCDDNVLFGGGRVASAQRISRLSED